MNTKRFMAYKFFIPSFSPIDDTTRIDNMNGIKKYVKIINNALKPFFNCIVILSKSGSFFPSELWRIFMRYPNVNITGINKNEKNTKTRLIQNCLFNLYPHNLRYPELTYFFSILSSCMISVPQWGQNLAFPSISFLQFVHFILFQ